MFPKKYRVLTSLRASARIHGSFQRPHIFNRRRHSGQQQWIQIDVNFAYGIVGRVSVVVHQSNLQRLVLQLGVFHLEFVPLGVPLGIQWLSANVSLVCCVAKFNFDVRVCCVSRAVHYWQVSTGQDLYFYLARHDVSLLDPLSENHHKHFIYKSRSYCYNDNLHFKIHTFTKLSFTFDLC